MADERNDEGIKGFRYTDFRTNADKFYRSPAAPISPGTPELHFVARTEDRYFKGACSCGHCWEVKSDAPYCTATLNAPANLFCPACLRCNGSAKSKNERPRVTEQIKSPDGQIHWIVFKQSDNAQCSCGHRWWRAGACSYDSLSGKVSECPCCPMCNERRRIPGQWNEPLFHHLPIQAAIRSQYAPGTKIATPAPSTELHIAFVIASSVIVGFCLGLSLGMWIGGLH